MSIKFSDDKISQVREASDLVDLISNYLTLKKAGKSFVGLCPFHTDSSPSFHVNPQTQLYYCFGCQKGGNVFNFLMDMEKMTFKEALEFLADRAGISLPKTSGDNALEQEKEALYFVNRWAANFYYKNLLSPQGKPALDYLTQRGISDKMIKTFGLGYSLPGWDSLLQQAKRDSISVDILRKSGLIIPRSESGYYDRFRGRFMVPIVNLYKKVLGFGGRIIGKETDQPKYINSPESPIYHKGNVLFGLFQCRQSIREKDQAIFVEGYTDLISLFQAGVKNVVATSGTALTQNQARLIRRYTENVLLLYDADNAGSTAAMRGADIFLDEGIEVNIVTLPPGEDPDSFIRKNGLPKFNELVAHSSSLLQFKISTLVQRIDGKTTRGLTQIINELLLSISRIKNSIKQNLALKEIAEYFSLEERALMQQLENLKKTNRIYPAQIKAETVSEKATPKIKTRYDMAEENLLRLVLEKIEWLPQIFHYLHLDDFQSKEHKQLFAIILALHERDNQFDKKKIMQHISDPDTSSKIATILTVKFDESTDRDLLFQDCIVLLKKRKLENQLHNLTQQIKLAQEKGTDAKAYILKYKSCQETIRKVDLREFFTDEENYHTEYE